MVRAGNVTAGLLPADTPCILFTVHDAGVPERLLTNINLEMLAMARRICGELPMADIRALHLPQCEAAEEYRDEFGFVFLEDGTAAPFYVSLPGTLAELHARFAEPRRTRMSLDACLAGLTAESLAERALALGAWNALGQSLFRRAGFRCPQRSKVAAGGPVPGERVGMVGFFRPIVDRLVADGVEVLVIERQPGRVPQLAGVELAEDPAALASCRLVYCTASTLINDSLAQVLEHCGDADSVQLIGPSGSGLPDLLFARGIDAVGGVSFADEGALRRALAARESWGSVGSKYELTPANYPGVDALLADAREHLRNS